MTPDQFAAWRRMMNWTRKEAAEALGLSASMVELYELGRRKEKDCPRKVVIPRTVELACAAISLGITHYEGPA